MVSKYTEGRLEVPPSEGMRRYVLVPELEFEKETFSQQQRLSTTYEQIPQSY